MARWIVWSVGLMKLIAVCSEGVDDTSDKLFLLWGG